MTARFGRATFYLTSITIMRLLKFSAKAFVALSLAGATSCVSYSKFSKLEQRVNDLSSQVTTTTADADNDGVPDSRDLEPRTPGDVNVDRFGRTVVERKQPILPTPAQPTPAPTNSMGTTTPQPSPSQPTPQPSRPVEESEEEFGRPQNANPPAGNLYHTIEKGDTLFSLARKYGTTVQEIRRLNGMGADNKIEIGQRIRVK